MRATICIRNTLRMGPVLDMDYPAVKNDRMKKMFWNDKLTVSTYDQMWIKVQTKKHHPLVKWDGPFVVKSLAIKAIEEMVDEMVKTNDSGIITLTLKSKESTHSS